MCSKCRYQYCINFEATFDNAFSGMLRHIFDVLDRARDSRTSSDCEICDGYYVINIVNYGLTLIVMK